ncbi:C3H1-type domain-containing protein [Mycena sanguinolenta]|uniref:C3H1-type domain-containing protein n=1 Tax=Mycena sanguinolenta TaxID=230812 RepID=A0A8H6YSA8_9AGAR|nr:C3H1-type domain-containing protein [Mycena sanguinolenta]
MRAGRASARVFFFGFFPPIPPILPPIRVSSPIRASPSKPRSPNRMQFQPASLDDPNRTPARRILVEDAVARGQISPQKGAQLRTNNEASSSRTPVFHIPPQDTPARRVNVNVVPPSTGQSKWQGMRFGSPTRGKSRERSGSAEPRPPWNASGPPAGPSDLRVSASKSRSSPSRPNAPPIKQGKLPFPLIPSGSDRPLTREADDKVLSPNPDAPAAPVSPVLRIIKVPPTLKQPTSRIPRIGTKPYARPAAAAKPTTDKNKKEPAASTRKVITAREPPARMIRVARTVSGSSSADTTAVAEPSSLKRKRIPSPQLQRPVVLIRQPPPRPAPTSRQASSSPVKRPPVAKFRMVDVHARPVEPEPKPPEAEMPPVSEAEPAPEPAPEPTPEPEPASELEPVVLDLLSPPVSSPIKPTEELMSDPAPHASSPLSDMPEPLSGVRRTTRLRKAVFPAAVGPPQPLPTRRKVNNQQLPSGSGVFAGMTAVALKALTSSNTTKNQKYLAAKLETEVIRKEGARPESPGVKIRTIAQREQDEKGMRRRERAARRARRTDGDGLSENDGMSDAGDESSMDDMDSSPLRRHRWGPGDEEEYQTPQVNGAKRGRAGSVSEEGQVEKKRVKWDRGLSTAVFLDEVEPRLKTRPMESTVKKGCLAPTAKAIQLDSLGNLPNAESPLKDLIEENVVVKKFVYENDEPEVPVTVVKNTRSKAKKKG